MTEEPSPERPDLEPAAEPDAVAASAPIEPVAPGPPPSVAAIVGSALDALQSAGRDLATLSAAVVIFGAVVVGIPMGGSLLYGAALESGGIRPEEAPPEFALLLLIAGLVAVVAAVIVFVQIPLLVIATVGGRLAGAPLSLRQALRRSRQVFLRGVGAAVLIGLATSIPAGIAQEIIITVLGPTELSTGLTVVASAMAASPWVYVLPGIVLGGVGVGEAFGRSWRIARFRWRIALTIAMLGAVGQVIVIAAAFGAVSALERLVTVTGLPEVPAGGEVLVGVAILFVGLIVGASILFGLQLVQFAPEASAFYFLTGYTSALEAARGGTPEPLFRRPALIFYGIGVAAGLVLLVEAIGRLRTA